MAPTERAVRYLSTLERLPSIPTAEVEKILIGQGHPVFPAWLDFHDRYAGYVEPIGHDTALWGILHEQSYWYGPRETFVEREFYEDTWYISCAELHPSYNYRLDHDGEFLGDPAESFAVKIERDAALWELNSMGGRLVSLWGDKLPKVAPSELVAETGAKLVACASDRFFRCYASDSWFFSEDVEDGVVARAWNRRT